MSHDSDDALDELGYPFAQPLTRRALVAAAIAAAGADAAEGKLVRAARSDTGRGNAREIVFLDDTDVDQLHPHDFKTLGALHAMLANVTPAERDQAWHEIGTELRQFESRDGFEGPCQLLIGSARRGA